MTVDRVKHYIATGFEQVTGWCSPIFLEIVAHLAEEMDAAGVRGGACEIGVYYGKFMIGLANAVDGRPSLAIDLFGHQAENIDYSGAGKADLMESFQESAAKYAPGPISCMCINSFALTVRDEISILGNFGPFQIFSIDGGHQAEHVINDYNFAQRVTHHGGIIIVDDITNPSWPGVMEGVARIFVGNSPKFVPLMLGHNKLVLAGVTFHKKYLRATAARIKNSIPVQEVTPTRLFGYDLLSLI
jgi:hypothetical protein